MHTLPAPDYGRNNHGRRGKHGNHFRKAQLNNHHTRRQAIVEQFFLEQQGRCAICLVPQSQVKVAFHLDHNHATKKNRGLLCGPCNVAIGMMRERPAVLRAAAEYLEKHNQAT